MWKGFDRCKINFVVFCSFRSNCKHIFFVYIIQLTKYLLHLAGGSVGWNVFKKIATFRDDTPYNHYFFWVGVGVVVVVVFVFVCVFVFGAISNVFWFLPDWLHGCMFKYTVPFLGVGAHKPIRRFLPSHFPTISQSLMAVYLEILPGIWSFGTIVPQLHWLFETVIYSILI